MNTEDKSGVLEAVLIAGLSALATGIVGLIIEEIKDRRKKIKRKSTKNQEAK